MALTETLVAAPRDARTPLPPAKRQWLAAFRAARRLMTDSEDTGQVFEIMRALNGGANARNYRRLLETPLGGRLAYEHVELAERLMDDAWLDGFAPGTVGAAYRDFVRSENLSAEGLAEISRARQARADERHPHGWFGRRIRDSHDIWHVLSGYHRDSLGEACLVAFSYAQTRALGWAFIAAAVALRSLKDDRRRISAIWQGWRRGRAAAWLPGEDYLELMNEPLEAARRRLRISAPTAYQAIPAADRA
jgi:ubiquinone biosynthesis protein COQ4